MWKGLFQGPNEAERWVFFAQSANLEQEVQPRVMCLPAVSLYIADREKYKSQIRTGHLCIKAYENYEYWPFKFPQFTPQFISPICISKQLWWTLWVCDVENKHTRHISKLHGMSVIQPKHSTYLQLLWILLCKLVKINSRLGTLNQEDVQIAQWCPTVASAMFSFLFSLLDSFKSQEGSPLCVRVNAH